MPASTSRFARLLRTLLITHLAVLLSACLALSEKPLSAPDASAVDADLIGAWQLSDDEGGTVTVHIGKENSLYCHPCAHALVYIEQLGDGRLSGDSYQGFVSRLGKLRYMNVRYRDPDRITEGYLFIRYALAGPDRLEVRIIDPEKLAKLVESKRLGGKLDAAGTGPAVLLTDPTSQLAGYFADPASDAAFGPVQTFVRIKPAPTP